MDNIGSKSTRGPSLNTYHAKHEQFVAVQQGLKEAVLQQQWHQHSQLTKAMCPTLIFPLPLSSHWRHPSSHHPTHRKVSFATQVVQFREVFLTDEHVSQSGPLAHGSINAADFKS